MKKGERKTAARPIQKTKKAGQDRRGPVLLFYSGIIL